MLQLHGCEGQGDIEFLPLGGLDYRLGLGSLGHLGGHEFALSFALALLAVLTGAAEYIFAVLLLAGRSHHHELTEHNGGHKTVFLLDMGYLTVDFHHPATACRTQEPHFIAYFCHIVLICCRPRAAGAASGSRYG